MPVTVNVKPRANFYRNIHPLVEITKVINEGAVKSIDLKIGFDKESKFHEYGTDKKNLRKDGTEKLKAKYSLK